MNNYGDRYIGIVGYLLDNEGKNTKPLHWITGGKDEYFVHSMTDVDYVRHKWGDIYKGYGGCLLTSPEANTIPMYHMRGRGTYYVFDKATADECARKWGDRIEGIVGYLYQP